ncbi:MAG: tRNA uridine-5-carboxymethylaminomethyl(34) synthesis enzyme MnmG [Candidatus Omnitrophica bacterium]|nr:tRNA uridine-5-carboxymethylaminomethyl(34) synthesis enzyme MnmG [Candidatus Omnitrophota bacterium]
MISTRKYDAVVVGAGHAGIEAALAISRSGYQVLLLTMDLDSIGEMSCNPAIGGLAKGHIVREIDALGGEMGLATDATGIQFRMLNRSKGPAVWAPRAQADKKQYHIYMKRVLEHEKNIHLMQAQVTDILVRGGKCFGVRTQIGQEFLGETVILSTGTFLEGLVHIGEVHYPAGRNSESPAIGLSESLRKHGIETVRFKTGTPPRLHAKSIDWSVLEEQKGDDPPSPFSFRTEKLQVDQLSCYLTYTNERTHDLIRKNLHRSPLYAGHIVGIGARYCPSIEDKVVKFADKTRHQIYLEPEGRDTSEIYANGLPTSLPQDVQDEMIHTIQGLENAEVMRWGYAIEYDCVPPTQLDHSLETKKVKILFHAGQINCTSGYEEAAAQGIMAGFNVIRKLRGQTPFVINRSEAYIGVLIDDLVTRGTNEPYRMFTSRAEFRLLLRQDNADERLMTYGYQFGLISKETYERCRARNERIQREIERLRHEFIDHVTLDRYLKRPDVDYKSLADKGLHNQNLTADEIARVEAAVKYEGYISRQLIEVNRFKKLEGKGIPENTDFFKIRGIRRETQEKLSKIRPASIGQASRIPGITACDLSLLAVYLSRGEKKPAP